MTQQIAFVGKAGADPQAPYRGMKLAAELRR